MPDPPTTLPPTDPAHDPGPTATLARAHAVDDTASEPIALAPDHRILVGTASWTDPTMVAPGVFYPDGADSAEERLAYYASRFPVVEVDATYYALPSERTSALWVERTPPDFTFDIKAHALMTGQPTETKRLPKSIRSELPADLAAKTRIYAKDLPEELRAAVWAAFREGIAPLVDHGQLGSVLLQYPRWFFTSSENRDAILEAQERLSPLKVAVEFRNETWFNEKNLERTLRFMTEHAVPLVMVDGPQGLKSSVPALVATPSPDLAVVRFHGRRAETWEARNIPTVERFRYLYDRDELEEWVPRIRLAASEVRETHVLMNNCYANYGSTNARELAALLLEPADD
ncbi:MAG TPA: DUF72 domain-containing protein [Candidatus Limnocylindrales bacterium]